MSNENPQHRKAERFELEDIFGSLNLLLEDYDWKKRRPLSRAQRELLEKKIAESERGESPLFEEVLKNYERNMHRGNNIHKAFALFDDVEQLLPSDAQYFREKLHDINDRIMERLHLRKTHGEKSEDAGAHIPMPHGVVEGLRSLLLEYRSKLLEHGHK